MLPVILSTYRGDQSYKLAATLRLDYDVLMGDCFFFHASDISAAGDVEHCTKLEATLVESFTLIFLYLQPYFGKHNLGKRVKIIKSKENMNLVSLLHCSKTSRAVLQLWFLL